MTCINITPQSMGSVERYFYSNFYQELRFYCYQQFDLPVEIRQFSTGYIEIILSLEQEYKASLNVRKDITLEFYELIWATESYQMRNFLKLKYDDLPLNLHQMIEPGKMPLTVEMNSPLLHIVAIIRGLLSEKELISEKLDILKSLQV